MPPSDWDPRIISAVRILENEQGPLPPSANVAMRLGLSPYHFNRLFKDQVGVSPQVYARTFLLEHVASRLRYTQDRLEAIAHDFGYSDMTALNRAFRKQFGIPPHRWREQAHAELPAETSDGVRLEHISTFTCLSRRYMGPRDQASAQWRDFLGRLPEALLTRNRVGLAYDDPRITPPERIRYDCAVALSNTDLGDVAPLREDGFELLNPPSGLYAVAEATTQDGIGPAYYRIAAGWISSHPNWTLEGDPFLERFTVTPENADSACQVLICLRVRKAKNDHRPNMQIQY